MRVQTNIFDDFFYPDSIPFREDQIARIEKTFKNFSGNLLLMGNSGTGKTTTIRYIMKKYPKEYLYTSASDNSSALRTIKTLGDINNKNHDVILRELSENLINNPKILIIDEVNKIYNISSFFDILNTLYRKTNVPIIIITNKQTIMEDMPDDARLTLFFQRIQFSSYNALELQKIVKQRLSLLQANFEIPDPALQQICAIAAKEGSARNALFMTKQCLINQDFSESYIQGLDKELQKEDWGRWIQSLTVTQKKFLTTLTELYIKNINNEGGSGDIKSFELQEMMPEVSPQRVSQLITDFENQGIILTKYINRGRAGGRYRLISFSNNQLFLRLEALI